MCYSQFTSQISKDESNHGIFIKQKERINDIESSYTQENHKSVIKLYDRSAYLVNGVNDDLTCMVCRKLMTKPIQTRRGHLACEMCYHNLLSNSEGMCPIDGEPISPKQIFKDKAKEKEILNLQCYCVNKGDGCMWSGTIRDLQKHKCNFEKVQCPFCNERYLQCEEMEHQKICRAIIKKGDCFYKSSGCQYHADTEEEMSIHIAENTNVHAVYKDSSKKYIDLVGKYEAVENDNKALKKNVDLLETKLVDSQEQFRQQIAQLTKQLSEMANKIGSSHPPNTDGAKASSKVTEQVEQKLNEISSAVHNNNNSITDLDLRLQLHENSTYDGRLVWKINDLQKRMQDAISGKITALHSAPCFTSQYGYKFCLRLYLNGDGMGRGTHLSLFLVIMKSEYDNVLEWPFRKEIKFTLMNQQNRANDIVERMIPNKDSTSFQKPKKEMNIASGCPLFFPLDRLENEGFIQDDSLFIDVQIAP